ncbi:MAG TPA: histidine kinase dimerization/phosphoacceptor domain -containing protein [Stellaceae bacterium]|jgi:chemotaxis protein methyltransferase CheR|nr:histidine kinase dimerization/phosphoacceptor domain -containing protein [Stellaceae bacterium]
MVDDPPITGVERHRSLEQAIVDTVREPLLVLDETFHVVTASRSFYAAFNASSQDTEGRLLFELGDGQWNIPNLRALLEDIIPRHSTIEEFEVEQELPSIGRRTMLLNARKIFYEGNGSTSILLGVEDITARRALEREKEELLKQKDLLLREMTHRVNNSLSIVASVLMLKAVTVQSEETRRHLHEAHERVLAIATVHEQLHSAGYEEQVDVGRYLAKLCDSLAASMIRDDQPISLRVEAGAGPLTSDQAVSMGLIVTELVINALKHAFPRGGEGAIVVRYESGPSNWRLSVSDDGVGITSSLLDPPARSGLGTSIVEALTRQLNGRLTTTNTSPGTTVSLTVPTLP